MESQHQQHHQHAPPGGSTIPICAFANNDIEQDKTPPQINIRQINLGPEGSAISALTNNTSGARGSTSLFSTGNTTTVHAATGAAMTPRVNDNNNTHRRVFMAASPDVPTPDFSRPSSDDNSLLSGDDSLGWDIEADRMLAQIECDAQIDIDADNDIEPLPEISELELLLQEAEEESIPDQQLVGQGEEEVEKYETVTVSVKNNTKNELINIAMELLIPKGGNKDKLYERIRDSGSEFISNVTDNSFDHKRRKNTVGGVSAGTCDDGPLDPNLP